MKEPWKKTLCATDECQKYVFDATGRVNEEAYLYPDVDNELMTQFTCPRCGVSETWGVTRRRVAKLLYDRLH